MGKLSDDRGRRRLGPRAGCRVTAGGARARPVRPDDRPEERPAPGSPGGERVGDDPESLVVAYLTQLLQVHEPDGFLARRIEVRPLGSPPTALVASLQGETFDPERHTVRTEVKAVTLHHLVFDARAGRARVIVDI